MRLAEIIDWHHLVIGHIKHTQVLRHVDVVHVVLPKVLQLGVVSADDASLGQMGGILTDIVDRGVDVGRF